MSDSDLIKLYSKQILALASSIPHQDPLSNPQYKAKARSPLCGSVVSVELEVKDGSVVAFSQNVKACALGQASSAIFGNAVLGLDIATIKHGRAQLRAMLMDNGSAPDSPFDPYHILEPARDFKNRHASILLPFEATLSAIEAGS